MQTTPNSLPPTAATSNVTATPQVSFQSPLQESPILQKPSTLPTSNQKSPKKFPVKLVLGVVLLLIVTVGGGIGFYLSQTSQEIRQQASTPNGSGTIKISPETTSFSSGSQQTLIITVNMGVPQVDIDGIQYIADITGTIPDDLAFTEATISGLNPITASLVDTTGGKKLSVAYLTSPPNVYSANDQDLVVGTLSFTTPDTGSMTITFDPTLSKILQNQTGGDILRTPGLDTYTFGTTSATNSPTPTPGSGATATPTPTPVGGTGGGGEESTPTPTPTATATPVTTAEATATATPTPTPTSGAGGVNTPTPTPTPTPTNSPTPTPTSNSTGGGTSSTSTPTPTPISLAVSQPATTQEKPVSGSAELLFILLLGGLLMTITGVYLFSSRQS